MTSLLRTFLALAIVAQGATAYARDGLTVSGIDVTETDEATEIRIHAYDNASYSVYRLRNPLRLFIDVAGSELTASGEPITVDNGVVGSVAATQYEDDVTTVSRVVIGFDQDALYDVVADGDDLVVTIDGSGRNLFVAGGPESAEDYALLGVELEEAMGRVTALEDAVRVARDSAQTAEAELLEQHLARERAERDRLAAIAEANQFAAENDGLRAELAASHARVESAEASRVSAERELAAQQTRLSQLESERTQALRRIEQLDAESGSTRQELASRDAELAALQQQVAGLSAAIDRGDSSLIAERDAQLAQLQSRQAELARLAEAARADEAALQQALGEARRSQEEQQALIQRQAQLIAQLEAAGPAPSGGPIADIRFEHEAGLDRIVIEAGTGAAYSTLPYEDGRSAIVFSAATLPDRLRRTLDTQAFQGPVAFVSSYTDTDGNVRVVAELGSAASEIIRQENGQIVWEFAPLTEVASASTQPSAIPTSSVGSTDVMATSYGSTVSPYAVAQGGGSGEINPFLQRPRMTRKRITIDLRDAGIQNVLRLIADEGNINIVAGAGVGGSITLRLRSVPLDDALVVILRSQNLGWEQQGNIIRVAPMAEFEERYEREMEMLANAWQLEPLRVRLIPVNYAEARNVASLVNNVLSTRGRVEVDTRNNALIVTDIVDHLDTAEQLVRRVDTQTPQILIEARIVETNDQFRRQLGIQWGFDFIADQALGNATGLLFPSTIGVAGGASDGQEPTAGTSSSPNFAVNLPAPAGTGSGGAVGFTFGSLSGAFNLNLRLSAAEDTGTAKVVSAPRIMTLDNQAAQITSGVSIPVSVVSAAGAQTVFFDAALTLNVTPRVTPDGNIFLTVNISKNEPDFENTGARGDPSIITREASTQLLVRDGDTTVIGGIFQRNSGHSTSRVPFFGSLPIIGAIFRNSSQTDVRNELLVFITPRIVNREASIDSLTSGVEVTPVER